MKPHVICHMAASVDGKTLLSRWKPEGRVAAGLFERLHDELDGDSWLVGRVTGQEFAKGSAYSASAGGGFHRHAWFARRDAKARISAAIRSSSSSRNRSRMRIWPACAARACLTSSPAERISI